MGYDSLYDTAQNKTLLAICARKLIRNIGIGALAWGVLNIGIGIVAVQANPINLGILILGVIMLATGIQALRASSLRVLLMETIVTVLLLTWNVGISVLNFLTVGMFEPQGLILPVVAAVVFFGYYRKLGHIREQISSVPPERIRETKQVCKAMMKEKVKDQPEMVQSSNRKCRAQLMDESAFFIQRNLMRAFVASKDDIRNAIAKLDAKSLKMTFRHPLDKLKYQFAKQNTEKIRNWLSTQSGAESGSSRGRP